MVLSNLVFLGAALQFIAGMSYIRDTLWGQTKPNRVTFFLWGLAPMIGVGAALSDGVAWKILIPVFMAGFVPLLILGASFANKKAYWKLTAFDYWCGAISVLALVLWGVTNQPVIAVVFAVLADGFAALPTLKKAWQFPATESTALYGAGMFSSAASLLLIHQWTTSEYLFPIYLIIFNVLIVFAIHRKKFQWKQ